MIREDNEHYQLGMFGLVVPAGSYIYASVNYAGARRGGASMTWAKPRPLLNRAVKAGDFIYVGRAFCDATIKGCNWSVGDEAARDLPLLENINPRLPWENLEVQ